MKQNRIRICFRLFFLLLLALGRAPATLYGQTKDYKIQGKVIDNETGEGLSYVGLALPENNIGCRSDENGRFEFTAPGTVRKLRIAAVGYRTEMISFRPDTTQFLLIRMTPEIQQLQEVTIKPSKYRNKNNPAVELIRLVIDHRDQNRVEKMETFQEERYEKVMMGLSKIPEKVQNGKALNSWRFVLKNADSTLLQGRPVVPIYLEETLMDFYSRNTPPDHKKYVKANQTVKFPGYLDSDGMSKGLQYVNQELDLYANYVELLTDHFLSPIANNAPLFYRYYPMDTVEVAGSKIVRLAFFPRNKTDMLLQGDLYVALDSTYPVTRAVFTVNPEINLNWVNTLELEQHFTKLPNGKWVLSEENYRMDLGLNKNGMGMYAERYVSHSNTQIDAPIADSLFRKPDEYVYLEQAEKQDTAFWSDARHAPLSATEANTYANMDSLQETKLFKGLAKTLLVGIQGYVPVNKTFEIGPLATFYAFSPVEGNRIRFGGRTSSAWSTKFRLEGYAAYGFQDVRWKFGGSAIYALKNSKHNEFPLNLVRINYLNDLRIPGQVLSTANPNSIFTSFVRGANDRFLYTDRVSFQYQREFSNHFSYTLGLERQKLSPAGALSFLPADGNGGNGRPVVTSNLNVQLRFAPGEAFFQSSTSRSVIDYDYMVLLKYTKNFSGVWGSRYDFHELNFTFRKYTNIPPIGYNYINIEAGTIIGKAPYPLLTIHRANQTYFYQTNAYNLMNFMEFISDRYVGFNMDHNFYGFFLNKIPLLRKLKLREQASVKVLYGAVSNTNLPEAGSGLLYFPRYPDGTPITYTLERKPYVEAGVGIGNIFKVLRLDYVRRFSYLDHPGAPKWGIRGYMQFYF
jgi:hypothetical protein